MTELIEEATEALARLFHLSSAAARRIAEGLSLDERLALHDAAETARATIRTVLGDRATF